MRKCKSCGKEQLIEEFPLAGTVNGVQYYRHICVQCYSQQKKGQKRRRIDNFREYKKTLKCNRCGYDDYRTLEFHHTDGNKEGNPSELAAKWGWEKLKEELDKCEVLCSNCHRIEHYHGV